ncbi:hypothetical protein ACFSKU_03390 [Pontibacter silvestris]|uniref:DUF4149 domain-containing protein n=1 Tax=Pontibacter silvestris TaxID=2305183 RepID=A0ABW4WT21_9BACT|nr:hypothetical protein [Pontibacter silvestris]MCC9138060.1 hypothetical protein [Pontibacter silvestris]
MAITDRPDIFNNVHAATLIAAGLTSYFLNESRPKTALIPPAVGGSLLFLTLGIKSGNRTSAHVAVGVTTLLTGMTARMLTQAVSPSSEAKQKFTKEVLNRRATVFGLMTVTGVTALGVYVAGFIAKQK